MANLFSITIGWLCVHFYWRGVHMLGENEKCFCLNHKKNEKEKLWN